ncbi:MAG: methyltransferase domain-containing protein [Caulobacteraceae bacterium]|nr:methyltransferase domain-containing protein [Caulobacteraceae bacterium]
MSLVITTRRTRRLGAIAMTGALALPLAACGDAAADRNAAANSEVAPVQEVFNPDNLDVPYVPTPNDTVAAMLDLGGLKAGDFVIDLGSGDGRILVAAARRGATGFGVDINPQRIAEANLNARNAGVADKVSFRRQDLFETPIAQASLLTMYLLPEVNLKLRPRILDEMKPGARVVSHAFDMDDWRPDATSANGRVYLWIVPAKVEGAWRITGGGVAGSLALKQKFQEIEGTFAGKPIRKATLRGDRIGFVADTSAGPRQFTGVVAANLITPAKAEGVPLAQAARGWRASRVG